MLAWLKKFEESSLGMLFTDQHLSPSEIVRIAQQQRSTDQSRRCAAADIGKAQQDCLPHSRLVGMR